MEPSCFLPVEVDLPVSDSFVRHTLVYVAELISSCANADHGTLQQNTALFSPPHFTRHLTEILQRYQHRNRKMSALLIPVCILI